MSSAEIVWLRDDPAYVLDDFASALDAAERATLAGFQHPQRQRSFILSRTLLRHLLAPKLDVAKNTIVFSRCESGRLALSSDSPWQFSLSHAAGLVAVMVARADCGVDIEVRRPVPFEKIARRYFSAAENAWLAQCDAASREHHFFRLWTLKEASVKALHEGLANNLSRLAFDVSAEPARLMDPGCGVQVFQQVDAGFYLAGAAVTTGPVSWKVCSTTIDDL